MPGQITPFTELQCWIPACGLDEHDAPQHGVPISRTGRGRVATVREPKPYLELYWGQSEPVAYVAAPGSTPWDFKPLYLFQGAPTRTLGPRVPPLGKGGLRGGVRAHRIDEDVVMYVGGPVWALDWAPHVGHDAHGNASSLLAVAAHPRGKEENAPAETPCGPAMVQIWEVLHTKDPAAGGPSRAGTGANVSLATSEGEKDAPRLVMVICHEGGLTWDCKWQHMGPTNLDDMTDASAPQQGAGTLALALGCGEVCVLRVPDPSSLEDPFVNLEPLAALRVPGSPACCLEWLPSHPYDRLLVGCWEGSVLICQYSETGGLQLLNQLLAGSGSPIRALAWPPPPLCEGSADLSHSNVFASAGHDGIVRIWDARDAFMPLYSYLMGSSWLLGLTWTEISVIATQDGCGVVVITPEGAPADKAVSTYQMPIADPIWAVHGCPGSNLVAMASGTGEVSCFPLALSTRSRSSVPHAPIAGFKGCSEGLLRIMGQHAIDKVSQLYPGAGERQGNDIGPHLVSLGDPLAAVHRVRWGPRPRDACAWLAHGGAAGIVRCQAVGLPTQ